MDAQVRETLGGLPLFASLSDAALDSVARRTVVRSISRNTMLFRQGDVCEGLYVVLEGAVRVYRASPDGREQVLHLLRSGQPVAELPLMDGGPYPASARAETNARVLFLPRSDFEWLYSNHAEVAQAVIRELGRRLRTMVGLVEKISLKDVPSRVATLLLEHATAAAGAVEDGTEFRLRRTQEELAAELATTRESVARALSRLRAEGAISTRGPRIRIDDVRALRSAAGNPRGIA